MSSTAPDSLVVRPARTKDVHRIAALIEPLVLEGILLGKELVVLFEDIQEFFVAEIDGEVVGCGALHVFWEHLGEVRTLVVRESEKRHGVGSAILRALEDRAQAIGLRQLFCLTFEVEFFRRHGYDVVDEPIVDSDVYVELVRSPDEGVAEFLDLTRVKPNTLGNSRMLKSLGSPR